MHDFPAMSTIPAFLAKLWKLVNDPETDELISWNHVSSCPCFQFMMQCQTSIIDLLLKINPHDFITEWSKLRNKQHHEIYTRAASNVLQTQQFSKFR